MKDLVNNFIFNHYLSLIEEMTALPPCKDFKSLKKELLKSIDLNPFLTGLIILLSGLLIFKSIYVWKVDFIISYQIIRTLGTCSCLYGAWLVIEEIFSGEFKKWFLLHFHELWFNKKQRGEVILFRYTRLKEEENAIETKFKSCEHEIKTDIKNFCESNFGVSTSSFLNFYQKKVLMGNAIYEEFLNYSLSIPRKKELGSDVLRKILLSFQPLNVVITDKIENHIKTCFSNYSLEQIETLFTSPHEKDYWEDLLEQMRDLEFTKPFRVYDSFYEMRFDEERIQAIPATLWALNEQEIQSYRFELLLTRKDYAEASDDFSNCLRHFSERWSSVIFRVKRKGKDYACVEIYKGAIRELKGPKNKDLQDPKLTNIIKNHLPPKK